MSQQAIKIGVMALADSLGNEYPGEETIETIADATGLDATVNGVTGNTEVCRIIIADNAVLPEDLVMQLNATVQRIMKDERVRDIVQT